MRTPSNILSLTPTPSNKHNVQKQGPERVAAPGLRLLGKAWSGLLCSGNGDKTWQEGSMQSPVMEN